MKALSKKIIAFRNARNWKQFHTPLNLALSLQIEVAELLEQFQWKDNADFVKEYGINKQKQKAVNDEVADILAYLILFSESLHIDLESAFKKKMKDNDKKYPIEKSKGNAKKYTEFINK